MAAPRRPTAPVVELDAYRARRNEGHQRRELAALVRDAAREMSVRELEHTLREIARVTGRANLPFPESFNG